MTAPPAGRPSTVTWAVRLVWALIVLAGVLAALSVVFEDELVRAFGAAGATADDTRVPPSFAPVAVVLWVTVSSLLLVLTAMLLGGHVWGRHTLAATVALIAVGTVSAMLDSNPPAAAVLGGLLSLVLDVLIVVLLYRPETTAYLVPVGGRGADAARQS
ncbi:hypothetical protein [Nocardioides sp. GXZ039]|uniref:hypothetical protein n=1 Tax=Nocardioides sp. GXZ039 TaxID=3136018 RepID=UPI0030F3A4FF